jgi:voltage-gated potassium channel
MRRRVLVAVLLLAIILVFGTVGYMAIERWGPMDALYMTVTSVTTVGFGEVHPLSPQGRLFTITLILTGVGALGYALATVIDFLVEGHLRGYLEERRMNATISALTGHHIVAGIGRVGSEVATAFAEAGKGFVVVDTSAESLALAAERGWLFVSGDAAEEKTLRAAGIDRAASLVTALDTDAANVFVTLTARGINPKLNIVARASASSAEEKLLRAGADRVITPTVIGGRRMASMVLDPSVSDYLDLVRRGDRAAFRLEDVELKEGARLVGRTISDARIRDATGALVLAIHDPDGSVNANPSSDTMLKAGDRLIVIGTVEQLEKLAGEL